MMKRRIVGKTLRSVVCALAFGLAACGDDGERGNAREFATAGQAAFWDTLFGREDRSAEAIEQLRLATRLDPADGRSFFLLGMMHLFRFSQQIEDFFEPSPADKAEIARAHDALERAVVLLPEDRRVPGFRGAATYMRGVVFQEEGLRELGLRQLRDSIQLYPEFNSFSFIGVVAPTVSADDPLYREVLAYVGDPLNAACSPFSQPEICGNAGKAPHNIEGSLVLFGDLFAKAGDMERAAGFYRLAKTPFSDEPWRFRDLIDERLRTLPTRVALYRDGDLRNDPPIIGYRQEACAICHFGTPRTQTSASE